MCWKTLHKFSVLSSHFLKRVSFFVLNRSCYELISYNFNISILCESELLGLLHILPVVLDKYWQIVLENGTEEHGAKPLTSSSCGTTGWWSCESLRGRGLRATDGRQCIPLLVQLGFFKASTLVMYFHVWLLLLHSRWHTALGGCFVFHASWTVHSIPCQRGVRK